MRRWSMDSNADNHTRMGANPNMAKKFVTTISPRIAVRCKAINIHFGHIPPATPPYPRKTFPTNTSVTCSVRTSHSQGGKKFQGNPIKIDVTVSHSLEHRLARIFEFSQGGELYAVFLQPGFNKKRNRTSYLF